MDIENSQDNEKINNGIKDENTIQIVDLLAILMHHKYWFISSIIICLLIGVVYIKKTPQIYQRSATIMIKDDKNAGSGNPMNSAFQDMFLLGSNSAENEMGFFRSKRLMTMVTKELHLDINYQVKEGLRYKDLYNETPIVITAMSAGDESSFNCKAKINDNGNIILYDIKANDIDYDNSIEAHPGCVTHTPMGRIIINTTPYINKDQYKNKTIILSKSNLKQVADNYNSKLQVELSSKNSTLINLSIQDNNISRAEDVLNTLIETYKRDAIDNKNQVVINTIKFINGRLGFVEGDLGNVDSRIENYKRRNKLTDITSEGGLYLENTGKLDHEDLSVENQLNMAEYMLSYLTVKSKASDLIPAMIGIDDNGIQNQINEYNELLTKKNKLAMNSSSNNPVVQDMTISLSSMRQSIIKAVSNLIEGLKMQALNMKNKQQENLNKLSDIPTQQKNVITIERQQKIKAELYMYLLNKKEESELQLSITESNCRLVDAANGPKDPVSPKKSIIILISIIIGASLPALWLYIQSLINTDVYTKNDIKKLVSIPFLAEIPLHKKKVEGEFSVKHSGKDNISEAFRILKDNMDFMNSSGKEGGGKVIQITSSTPGSGKTFISSNLAMTIAQLGVKVIVLDLDLRKGTLTRKLARHTRNNGLSLLLSGKATDHHKLITKIGNNFKFDLLTSGPIPPNPSELLKSKRLEELINLLKTEYDYILMDNPPYGIIVDASICNRLVDQTIYIIRSGMYDKRLLPELQEIYDNCKLTNMSILLNGVDYNKIQKYGYGYGYGFEYKYGYEYDNQDHRNKHSKISKFISKL